MFRNQTFRLFAGSFVFLTLCQVANRFLDPPVVCNKGVGFGIDIPVFALVPLVFLALLTVGFFIWKILTRKSTPSLLTLSGASLLVGGAFSNITDRLTQSCIPDFFHIGWFPAFNVADIGISGGVIILLIAILRK